MLKYTVIVTLISGMVMHAGAQDQDIQAGTDRPKNIILMIGDGMGLSQVSAPYYYGDKDPAFNRFTPTMRNDSRDNHA